MSLLLSALLAAWLGTGPRDASVTILSPESPDGAVLVAGLDAETVRSLESLPAKAWPARFAVYVATEGEIPPVMGRYEVRGNRVAFTPRFPFVPGQRYRATFLYNGESIEMEFALPNPRRDMATEVERIYPGADVLPENLLKFYVYFTAPMRGADVYDGVRLLAQDGSEIEGAFVVTVPELWDPDMRRLTLMLHPGRIKRGLELHEREGPPLRSGERFRLVVDGLEDAWGQPLATGEPR